MRTSSILVGLAATQALAYPGMGRALAEIQSRHDFHVLGRSTDLLGDLVSGALSDVGSLIKSILQGASAIAGETTTTTTTTTSAPYQPPGDLGTSACSADPLCLWYWVIKQDLTPAFVDARGCTDLARGAIRQGFHDAATWDKTSSYGGADGSLLLSADELSRPENAGLEPIGAQTRAWYDKYHTAYGAGMADLIQTAALVAVVSCPGGPRIRAFVGRADDSRAGPLGMLPAATDTAQFLVDLFAAKTFSAADLVALVGAHTASKQTTVDPGRAGASQDSTPGTWDNLYYGETKSSGNDSDVLVFPSDRNLAQFSQTSGLWDQFAAAGGQRSWSPAFAAAYFRMSMLGVDNMNSLTDITPVIPLAR
ncbi:heme peroxidase [Xylariomycetidae sp. FL2044]|nr:heme peroxidase [Xylariomycetidae sp. FL2044]